MNAFPHLEDQHNAPGFDTFYFADASTIGALTINSGVAATAPSMGGAVFYEGYSTAGKLECEVVPVTTEEGVHYEVTVKGVMPKIKSSTLMLFEEMLNKYFNLVVRTKAGKHLWLGAPAEGGLNFTYKQNALGYEFEFSGTQAFAPPFYTAAIPV